MKDYQMIGLVVGMSYALIELVKYLVKMIIDQGKDNEPNCNLTQEDINSIRNHISELSERTELMYDIKDLLKKLDSIIGVRDPRTNNYACWSPTECILDTMKNVRQIINLLERLIDEIT